MKINTKILIDRFVGQLIWRLIEIVNFFSFKKNGKIKPEKICIILLSEMGSLSVTFAMIQVLKKKYINSDIYILTLKRNDEIIKIMELVLEENIITIDDSSLIKLISSSYKSIQYFRTIQIDTVIDCELFARVSSIYSYFSGVKIRIGFHPNTQKGLYRGNHINRQVLYNPHIHISHQFINLVESIESKERIELSFPDFIKQPIVIINPGDCVDMTGFTRSAHELLILFTLSKLLITNDGGSGHFSSLTSLPSIILFGPEIPVLYGSLNPNAANMHADILCSPRLTAYNHRNSPCNGNNLCLKAIKPEQVLDKTLELLSS